MREEPVQVDETRVKMDYTVKVSLIATGIVHEQILSFEELVKISSRKLSINDQELKKIFENFNTYAKFRKII